MGIIEAIGLKVIKYLFEGGSMVLGVVNFKIASTLRVV